MKNYGFLTFVVLIVLQLSALAQKKLPYQDPKLTIEERLDDLMSRMTLEEKIAQMCQYVAPKHILESKKRLVGDEIIHNDQWGLYKGMSIDELKDLVKAGQAGSFLHVKDAAEANELQELALQAQLKIPLIIGIDAIHGHAHIHGATVYPTQLSLSSSFDDDLLFRIARATAKEMRATGMHWNFSPNVDVARDPRWGRSGETFGEDPYMVTRMGVAFTRGYQGDFGQDNVLACAKHYIAGSEPYNGTNASPMDVSLRQLREVWLPPYKAQVEAGVYTFMAAHNEVSGVPSHGNKFLMRDILRDEWGFEGFVVSDWMDIERLAILHHVAEGQKAAVKLTVESGMDMHMHGPDFLEPLAELVNEGEVAEELVDESARKILMAKFMLGLFEQPFVKEKQVKKVLFNEAHQALALEAARKSIILLKNENDFLPIRETRKILVTGPNANNHRVMGDWALEQPEENIQTIYEGFKMVYDNSQVDFINSGESLLHPNDAEMTEAVEKAADYDLVVAVVGSNSLRYDRGEKNCGENVDRATINLQGNQLKLIKELYARNKNVLVVLVNGRPLAEPWIKENIPAIIEAWEPGAFAGQAVAEIVKGEVNPSGKLTMTIPYHVGQVPYVYYYKPSNFFHKYVDMTEDPLWSFGYGLSYTSFEYKNLQAPEKVSEGEPIQVTVEVRNTGEMAGEEVIQLYIRDDVSSATRPVKELKDYKRIALAPGETKKVEFELPLKALAFYDIDMNYVVEKGSFTLMVGSSSMDKDLLTTKINISKNIDFDK